MSDSLRDKQLEMIEEIKSEICLDTDIECPTCEGKGYIGYLDWDSSKPYVQSWEYIDDLGYKLVDGGGKLILVKKIEFTFENFISWASDKFQEPKGISSLGGRTIFIVTMIFDDGQFLKIDYGKKNNTGFMPRDQLKIIWDRYINLKNRKLVTGEYTDPRFRKTPNRILAPYVAAVIREFEVECSPNAWG
jgi:hypothetical protein